MRAWLFGLVVLVACRKDPRHERPPVPPGVVRAPAVTPSKPGTTPPPRAAPTPPPPPPHGPVLAQTTADLDGDGRPDTVTLVARSPELTQPRNPHGGDGDGCVSASDPDGLCHATLAVNGALADVVVNWAHPDGPGDLHFEVIDMDASEPHRELVLRQRAVDSEDPPFRFVIARYDGSALTVTPLWGGEGEASLVTHGDGLLTAVWDGCPDRVEVMYGRDLVEIVRQAIHVHAPGDCAACPVVYLSDGETTVRAGEILRNLSSPALDGAQALRLAPPWHGTSRRLELRLAEEKQETTFLDEVHLEVDGHAVAPVGCPGPAYCAADGRAFQLRTGDTVPLVFELGGLTTTSRVELRATGHYLPLP